jgi:hypothetical protein
MPFTFSHPAIVFPLINKRNTFSATGLIIGSIAPDFESFVRISGPKIYSHTWFGVFWFDLPLTFALCLVYHLLIKHPLIDNLPIPLRERAEPYRNTNWMAYLKKNFLIAILSMIVGIVTHLLFDALTHLNLADPDATTSNILMGHTRLYIILQYSLSLVCLLIIARVIYSAPRHSLSKIQPAHVMAQFWLFFGLITLLVASVFYTIAFEHIKFDVIVLINIIITSTLSSLIIVCAGYMIWQRTTRNN